MKPVNTCHLASKMISSKLSISPVPNYFEGNGTRDFVSVNIKHFSAYMISRVQLFATLWTIDFQASFCPWDSRQEYWIGLPYPSLGILPDPGMGPETPESPAVQAGSLRAEPPEKPRHFSVRVLVAQICVTLCGPVDSVLPGSSVRGILLRAHLSGLPFPPPGDLPDPGIKPRSSALQADSLLSEPRGKPQKLIWCVC